MTKTAMQFLFGDRELVLMAGDLLAAPVDVLVNPEDTELSGSGLLAQRIREAAGPRLVEQTQQLIREYGSIEQGMAVYTAAGNLGYTAVIHGVGPVPGSDEPQRLLEQLVSRSLQLCELNEWRSVAFPDFVDDQDRSTIAVCAQAFYRAITHFWDARYESGVEKVMVYVRQEWFRAFFDAFREDSIESDKAPLAASTGTDDTEPVGHVSLSESDIDALDDPDIDDWFK